MNRRIDDRGYEHPVPSEITPRDVALGRRRLLQALALGAAGGSIALWAGRRAIATPHAVPTGLHPTPSALPGARVSDPPTAAREAMNYNNFYEFGFEKTDPAEYASAMKTRPWKLTIDGLVARPRSFEIDELLGLATMEERVYRLRCVEGWSMVIPWIGYSLERLLRAVEPLGSAKYLEFTSHTDEAAMPNLRSAVIDWPYREGLRLDEARHPLTLLAFGMYGEVLPNQNGAPLRLVVPWKYGFKGIKSIVRIRLTSTMPKTAWSTAIPSEYGFYANVNPEVDHPRWSQATERRIGQFRRIPTLMFNGYADQVASLYSGVDLRRNY